jgi:hypothetical protein
LPVAVVQAWIAGFPGANQVPVAIAIGTLFAPFGLVSSIVLVHLTRLLSDAASPVQSEGDRTTDDPAFVPSQNPAT